MFRTESSSEENKLAIDMKRLQFCQFDKAILEQKNIDMRETVQ